MNFHPECRADKPSKRDGLRAGLTFGGALIIMGGGFLLDRLGLLHGLEEPWQVWPVILVLMGLLKLVIGRSVQHAIEAVIVIGVGAVVQAHYLGMIHLEWDVIWPALLILAGLFVFIGVIAKAGRRRRQRQATPPSSSTSSSSFIEGDVLLGSREEHVESDEFEGGDIRCVLGGFNLDLSRSKVKDGQAVIHVRAVLGGIEIKVPEDWTVVVRGKPMMGAFENKTLNRAPLDPADEQRLIIEGSVVMGGVEIKN
jgi:predicted membrane protein